MMGPRLALVAGLAVGTLLAFGTAEGGEASVSKEWQSLDLAGLTQLARDLDAKGDAGAKDRQALAGFVAKRYASDKAAGKVDWNAWLDLAAVVGPQLPDEVKKSMAADLVGGMHLKDSAGLAALTDGQILQVAGTLGRLGREDEGRAACAAWINASDRYQAAGPATLHALGWNVSPQGKAFDAARGRLAEHLRAKYLADPAAARSVGGDHWHALALDVGKPLPPEARALWVAKLRAAFVGDARATSAVKGEQMVEVAQALDALGDKDLPSFFVAWVRACDTWQALKPGALPWLIENLTRSGDAGKVLKPRVAEHITQRVLADPAAVRAVRYWDWRGIAEGLSKDLDEGTRRVWVERLRAALADPKRLGAADQEVLHLREALAALGDPQADAIVTAWMSAGTGWESSAPWGLQVLAENLVRMGDGTKALRQRLIEHVGTKRLATRETARKASCGDWKGLARVLVGDMDEAARKAWVGQLRGAFADAKGLASLEAGEALDLREALETLGDPDALGVVQAFMDSAGSGERLLRQPGTWGPLLKDLLRIGDPAKPSRLRVAALVAGKYLASAEAARSVGPGDWRGIAEGLSKDLDEDARRTWIRQLRGAWAEAKALTALRVEDLPPLQAALESLGDKDACGVTAAWMAAPGVLEGLDPEGLRSLARTLEQGGDQTRTLRADLATFVNRKHLEKPGAARRVACWQWKEMAEALGKGLDEPTRRAWRGGLRAAFGEPKTLAGLAFNEAADLRRALEVLGEEAPFDIIGTWMRAGEAWKGLAPAMLQSLAWHLEQGGAKAREDRARLAAYVTEKYLGSPAAVRTGTSWDWNGLAVTLRGELGAETRAVWIKGLRSAFAEPTALASLRAGDLQGLASALEALGDARACDVVIAWAGAVDWSAASHEDLRYLASALARAGKEGQALRRRLAETATRRYMATAEAVRAATPGDWRGLIESLRDDLDAPTRLAWQKQLRAVFAAPKVLASLRMGDVDGLSGALEALGDARARDVVTAWAGAVDWSAASLEDLRCLAPMLARTGDEGQALRRQVAETVTRRYLAMAEGIRAATPGDWRGGIIEPLAADLDAPTRLAWQKQLRSAFTVPEVLAALRLNDMGDLASGLKTLGDQEPYNVIGVWMRANETWKGFEPAGLQSLAWHLEQAGPSGREDRASLGMYVTKKYLSDPAAIRTGTCSDWGGLAGPLRGELGAQTRAVWIRGLRGAYADPKALGGLPVREALDLAHALETLGDEQAYGVVSAWMTANPAWPSLSPEDLRILAEGLERGGDAAKALRLQLAEHVLKVRLADAGAARAAALADWQGLVERLRGDLGPAACQAWAERLRAVFADPKVMAAMQPQDVGRLSATLRTLGDKEGPKLLASWILARKRGG